MTLAVETKYFLDVELTVVACGGGGILVSPRREFFRVIGHSKRVWEEGQDEVSGKRSNALLKICNLIRVHPQRHNSVRGVKHVLKNVKIIIAKRFGRALPYIAS